MAYHWPGNVRELENIMRKLTVLRAPDLISRELLERSGRRTLSTAKSGSAGIRVTGTGSNGDTPVLERVIKAKEQAESEAILSALNSTRWNRKQAAVLLKIDYKALLYKMKKLGLDYDATPDGNGSGTASANTQDSDARLFRARQTD